MAKEKVYSDALQKLLNTFNEPCELEVPNCPPEWLDKQLFLEGRDFFWKNYFTVVFSSVLNLLIGISLPNLCHPLVLTRRSETVEKAFVRYSMTGHFIQRIYQELPWEEDGAVQKINAYHSSAAKKMRQRTKDQLKQEAQEVLDNLPKEDTKLSHLDRVLLRNVKLLRETTFAGLSFDLYNLYINSTSAFSHFDMAMVQSAFFASIVTFPGHNGVRNATRRELEGLMHVWKVTAYYLGVPDRANLVQNTLEQTRQLLLEIGHEIVVPAFLHIDPIAIHMGKKVAMSIHMDYHVLVYHNLQAHGHDLALLWKEFEWKQKLGYFWLCFLIGWLYYIPIFRYFWNALSYMLSQHRIKKAVAKGQK